MLTSSVAAQERRIVPTQRREHRFFIIMAVLAIIVAAVAFGPTYYLRTRTPTLPLTPLVEIHGAVFTGWLFLYLAQTLLVARGRFRWHMRLGVATAIWAGVLVVIGCFTAIAAARRGYNPAPFGDALTFLAVPIGDLLVFLGLVIPALFWRKQKETHKRLMLLATISLLGAAFTRFPVLGGPVGLIPYSAMAVALPIYDYVSMRRIPRASVWGALWVVFTIPVRSLIGQLDEWRQFAGWLVS